MISRLYCLLFVIILFLPTLQHIFNIFPDTILIGKEKDPPRVIWTISSWLDGSFQDKYGKRRDSRLGLRSHMVKTHNQLHYSLFNRIVSNKGTNVVIGKDNWLYEKTYIDKLTMASKDDGSLIDSRVQHLRHLQDQLQEIGIAFVFVIAPSKAKIHPEHIPDNLRKSSLPAPETTDYLQAKNALLRYGVNFVDSHTLFLQEKQKGKYQLFGPSGVHWNKYGAYLAWKQLAALMQDQIKVPLMIPALTQIESRPSEPVEADLGGLLNLWNTDLTSPETDYPVFDLSHSAKKTQKKPSLLIIGDSFLFTLVDIVERAALSADVDAWYYFKRHFSYPAQDGHIIKSAATETPVDKKAIDWQNQLLNKDLVILVATEYWLPELGWGFIEEASEAVKEYSKVKKP